jgi:hypothetical protein
MGRISCLLLAAAAWSSAGCELGFPSELSTEGELGAVSFSYVDWAECGLRGCALDSPLMVGTRELVRIVAQPSAQGGFSLLSSDPQVMAVGAELAPSCCAAGATAEQGCKPLAAGERCAATASERTTVELWANQPGQAVLCVVATDGQMLDRLELTIEPPASVELGCAFEAGAELGLVDLGVGQACGFHASAFDSSGQRLKASHGFEISVADPAVAALRTQTPFDSESQDYSVLDDARGAIHGRSPGATVVAARVGDHDASLPVSVR